MTLREIVGTNIMMYRHKAGLTQTQLAKKVGVNTCTIGGYETARIFPSAESLEAIAMVLNVKPHKLLKE